MKPKTVKFIYWTATVLFVLLMLMDGITGVSRVEAGQEAMRHLGYPIYCMTILGVAKILGAFALLQPIFRTLKEWAYAGFTINFLGAFASHFFTGDSFGMQITPLIVLVFMFLTYFLWKKKEQIKMV
jgi:DoxX-like family